jgi:hypothetical protein
LGLGFGGPFAATAIAPPGFRDGDPRRLPFPPIFPLDLRKPKQHTRHHAADRPTEINLLGRRHDAHVPGTPVCQEIDPILPPSYQPIQLPDDHRRDSPGRNSALQPGKGWLRRLTKRPAPGALKAIERCMAEPLEPVNILDVLTDTDNWLHWTQFFSPLSGQEARVEAARARYVTTAFCYGCNLGPTQTAQALQTFDRRQIARIDQHHITEEKLDAAITTIINAYNRFALPKLWGSGKHASADRELGRVVRTAFLLRYLSDAELRQTIHAATNKSEAFNRFLRWVFFGGEGLIASNNRRIQRKRIKYSHLIANCVIFHNVQAQTRVLHQLAREGYPVDEEVLARLSPYLTAYVNRFGNYTLDFQQQVPLPDYTLHLPPLAA